MLVWTLLPLKGPLAAMGRVVPVPIGVINGTDPFWYHRALRIASWYDEKIEDKVAFKRMVTFSSLVESFAKEMDVYERSGFFRAHAQSPQDVHGLVIDAAREARARGEYQNFALERVEHMRGLIDLGIYFNDLAYQYTELPSSWTTGVRVLEEGDVPAEYDEAISSGKPVLVEFEDHYVFVRMIDLEDGTYRVAELGIEKQDLRETVYAFLLAHEVKWF